MWDTLPMELRREIIHMAKSMHAISMRSRFDLEKVTRFTFRSIIIGNDLLEKDLMTSEILFHSSRSTPLACVFSDRDTLSKHIPDLFISDLSDAQTKLVEIYDYQTKQPYTADKGILIVLEMNSKKTNLLESDIVRAIFSTGHHYNISIILSIEKVQDLNTCVVAGTDYIFCLKNINSDEFGLLHKYLDYGVFENETKFVKKSQNYMEEYGCMVWNNKTWTPRRDALCWYKSKPRQFRFGSHEFLEYGDKYGNCTTTRKN